MVVAVQVESGDGRLDSILEEATVRAREQSSVKSDGAPVPEELWRKYVAKGRPHLVKKFASVELGRACDLLRRRMLRWWKRRVTASLSRWVSHEHPDSGFGEEGSFVTEDGLRCWKSCSPRPTPLYVWGTSGREDYRRWFVRRATARIQRDLVPGGDAVARAANSTWFEWSDGSRPFHWRWPAFYHKVIRDGLKVFFRGDKPNYRKPQDDTRDPAVKAKMKSKLASVRDRRYISPGFVRSLTSFFAVKKGDDDIRMVYDATKSGLNESIWVPGFPLPTIESHLRAVEEGTFMCDLDIGEMFLNFNLHTDLQELSGIDVTLYLGAGGKVEGFQKRIWHVWLRAAMGLKSSPYQAVQGISVAEELLRGDPSDPSNPFRWDRVVMNLPGSRGYSPSKPWVYKVRSADGKIACDIMIFVDDLRVTGPTQVECWEAGQHAAKALNGLGIQDAARKTRDARTAPGPWAGTLVNTANDGVFVLVSQEKWDKTGRLLAEVRSLLEDGPEALSRKRLQQVRGYLQYVASTYKPMTPYLIGFHLTIDGWRRNRDKEGYRLTPAAAREASERDATRREDADEVLEPEVEEAPVLVAAAPRFRADIEALLALTSTPSPPLRRRRCSKTGRFYYGFGDASGRGFGATFQVGDSIHYEYGQWTTESSEESSNWRELANLVEALEHYVSELGLTDCEIFIFTDNTTAESAFWKGHSSSKRLSALVLRLKQLEMGSDIILHLVHVSGTRMIAEGCDGLSRGDKSTGVMQGVSTASFIPLHLSAFERSPALHCWMRQWTRALDFTFLDPSDWFTTGHSHGHFVWSPPPAAAAVVVEQLGKARMKRPEALHLVVVPRLMTGLWRRHLTRTCDAYFRVRVGSDLWPASEHEPLLIFVCLPFVSSSPGLVARAALVAELSGVLPERHVWEGSAEREGDFLCKLLCKARKICPM